MSAQDAADIYRQAASESRDQLQQALLDLKRNPADADPDNQAFRALRTIEGSGAMFGSDRVAAPTYHAETALDLVRKGKVSATAELIAPSPAAKERNRRLIGQTGGGNALGIIMTGMGDDGAPGLMEMRGAGASPVAQDEARFVVFGMPKEAIVVAAAAKVLPLERLAGEIVRAGR